MHPGLSRQVELDDRKPQSATLEVGILEPLPAKVGEVLGDGGKRLLGNIERTI